MREIKFRVWDSKRQFWLNDKKNWLPRYWYSFYSIDKPLRLVSHFNNGNGKETTEFLHYENESSPYKIQQFTGLKDKNGKEIYEGDVINQLDWNGVVIFDNGCFMVNDRPLNAYTDSSLGEYVIKVIGNIFKNPEFLKP